MSQNKSLLHIDNRTGEDYMYGCTHRQRRPDEIKPRAGMLPSLVRTQSITLDGALLATDRHGRARSV
jgi:hypothetical protein